MEHNEFPQQVQFLLADFKNHTLCIVLLLPWHQKLIQITVKLLGSPIYSICHHQHRYNLENYDK